MTDYSQKWTIVTFLQPVAEGTQYAMQDWPPHVTLADVFAVDIDRANLLEKLSGLAAHTQSFRTAAQQNTQLGNPNSPVDVTLLEKNDALASLHNSLIRLLEENGAVFNTPEYTRQGFLPHITVRSKNFLPAGEQILIGSFSVIDMFPDNDWQQRKVVATYDLKKKSKNRILKGLLITLLVTAAIPVVALLAFIALGAVLSQKVLEDCDKQGIPHSRCQW